MATAFFAAGAFFIAEYGGANTAGLAIPGLGGGSGLITGLAPGGSGLYIGVIGLGGIEPGLAIPGLGGGSGLIAGLGADWAAGLCASSLPRKNSLIDFSMPMLSQHPLQRENIKRFSSPAREENAYNPSPPNQPMDFLRVSWDDASRMCERLASGISSSGFRPEVIIGISRGGLVPARLLSDIMDVRELYVMRVSFYKGIGKKAEAPEITQPLSARLGGKRALLVDDVSDTGKSLEVAKEHVLGMGAGEVKVATLHFKPHSSFRPDFFVAETGAWIIYPWELHECRRELGNKMPK